MLYHLIFPAVAPCQGSSIRVRGWFSVINGKPLSPFVTSLRIFQCPAVFHRALAVLLGLAVVAAGSWDCSFDLLISPSDLWKVTRLTTSCAFWIYSDTSMEQANQYFFQWSVLEEDSTETELFFFSFSSSVPGEMDSSLASCALQEMQLRSLCRCHSKHSPDID